MNVYLGRSQAAERGVLDDVLRDWRALVDAGRAARFVDLLVASAPTNRRNGWRWWARAKRIRAWEQETGR